MSAKTVVGKLLNPVATATSMVTEKTMGIKPDSALGIGLNPVRGVTDMYEKSGQPQDMLAPPSAPSDDLITSAQDAAAKGQARPRGRAATMLTGSKGVSTKTASISSAGRTLLG